MFSMFFKRISTIIPFESLYPRPREQVSERFDQRTNDDAKMRYRGEVSRVFATGEILQFLVRTREERALSQEQASIR